VLEGQFARLQELANEVATATGSTVDVRRFWTSEPTPFAPEVVTAIADAVADLGLPHVDLWSGAGHDAKYAAEMAPSGMIFVRSQAGLSHCESEFSTPADITAGANVLLGAALRLAGAN
jgi:N-carbamoyl-L-amino-acid hydrolase